MKVLVCGGRDYSDADLVSETLLGIYILHGTIAKIIHGGALGADLLAGRWGHRHGVPVSVFRADWGRDGRAAGPIRNQRMLDEGKPNLVVVFPGGRGTADMVARARKARVPILVVNQASQREDA